LRTAGRSIVTITAGPEFSYRTIGFEASVRTDGGA
jgi:hypothetical protein